MLPNRTAQQGSPPYVFHIFSQPVVRYISGREQTACQLTVKSIASGNLSIILDGTKFTTHKVTRSKDESV